MSDWAKELLADVAREAVEDSVHPRTISLDDLRGLLERRLLVLLEAGQAIAADYDRIRVAFSYRLESSIQPPSIELQKAYAAAKAVASQKGGAK